MEPGKDSTNMVGWSAGCGESYLSGAGSAGRNSTAARQQGRRPSTPLLTLFLVVGFVWSASAQQVDPKLVGNWRTYDGPCRPCVLSIQKNGTVKFNHTGTELEVSSQITPDPGIKLTLPLGGTLDLAFTKSSKYLVGYYNDPNQSRPNQPVAFRRK